MLSMCGGVISLFRSVSILSQLSSQAMLQRPLEQQETAGRRKPLLHQSRCGLEGGNHLLASASMVPPLAPGAQVGSWQQGRIEQYSSQLYLSDESLIMTMIYMQYFSVLISTKPRKQS